MNSFSKSALCIGAAEVPNRVILAPMSGITDAPFRRFAERLGAGLVVSEMTACAGLALGEREAIVRSDGEGIAIHPVGNLAMSWDHRAFDGAYAAGFLVKVKQLLETRDWSAEL